jgi:hypothetical protein
MLVVLVNGDEICFNYGTKLHVVRIKMKINNMKTTALVLFVLALVCFLVLLDI